VGIFTVVDATGVHWKEKYDKEGKRVARKKVRRNECSVFPLSSLFPLSYANINPRFNSFAFPTPVPVPCIPPLAIFPYPLTREPFADTRKEAKPGVR